MVTDCFILQAESRQQQIVDLQQQVQLLQHKLDHSESPQGNASPSKLPLQEQQVPQNPIMAEAKAEAHDRPAWQRPMALHLSEAEKAELHVAEAGPPGDENGVTPSLLGGNSGLQLWEEKKKMQKRMENLRAKLKVKDLLCYFDASLLHIICDMNQHALVVASLCLLARDQCHASCKCQLFLWSCQLIMKRCIK